MNKLTLFSTGCPRCKVLKQKLQSKNIEYDEVTSVDDMLALGITEVPVLRVDGELLDFLKAIAWVNNQ